MIDPDSGENLTVYASIRGPVETKINTIQKAGLVADVPNMSLVFYISNTEKNRQLFERYCRFEFAGRYWMVQAPDAISTPGILEIAAEEDYNCDHDNLIEEVVDPNEEVEAPNIPQITGETFIKPLQEVNYVSNLIDPESYWYITLASDNKEVADVLTWSTKQNVLTVKWTAMVSGQFEIHYGPLVKTVVVESLF